MSDASVESPHIFFKPPVEGRRLARQLSKMSSARKALLAHEIETGTVSISKLSRRQTSRLLKVATGYIATVSRISDADRERLKHNPYLLTAWHNRRSLKDADVERLLARNGLDRALSAIDRMTAPPPPKVQLAAE
jgi:hypothetical protein